MRKTKNYRTYCSLLLNTVSVGLLVQMQDHLCARHGIDSEEVQELCEKLGRITQHFRTERCCPRCGSPLYLSDLPQYDHVCYTCDENY